MSYQISYNQQIKTIQNFKKSNNSKYIGIYISEGFNKSFELKKYVETLHPLKNKITVLLLDMTEVTSEVIIKFRELLINLNFNVIDFIPFYKSHTEFSIHEKYFYKGKSITYAKEQIDWAMFKTWVEMSDLIHMFNSMGKKAVQQIEIQKKPYLIYNYDN